MYNFDQIINRHNTDCIKYDGTEEVFGRSDILPMWIADMDFQSPPEIIAAIKEFAERGVFGYSFRSNEAKDYFINWVANRYDWSIEREWMSATPGIVSALSLGVQAYTNPGDKVLIFTPVYPPFFSTVRDNNRTLVTTGLLLQNNRYEIDWDDFEQKISDGVKLLILCSPHNPVGREWSKDELLRIGEMCVKYGVIILSDEIHCDLSLFGHRHTVLSSLSEEIAATTVTMMAPSKTFNIAGTINSVIIIPSLELRTKFLNYITPLHIDSGNIFGHVTFKAAYRYGAPWLEAMLRYVENNVLYAAKFVHDELPGVSMVMPECSFLLWLDFRGTGMTHKEVGDLLVNKAKIGLNDGLDFGPEGEGFRRMNIGCPLSTVKEGLQRIKSIF